METENAAPTPPGEVPARDEVVAYVAGRLSREQAGTAGSWATALTGLQWRWIVPVVDISMATGNHAAVTLATAAEWSQDESFVAAARAQLDRLPAPTGRRTGRRGRRQRRRKR